MKNKGKMAVFRVDASEFIGTGHVMRCLTLAEMLRDSGMQVYFFSREYTGNLTSLVKQKGYRVINLPNREQLKCNTLADLLASFQFHWDIDAWDTIRILHNYAVPEWLIVDHYGLDKRWENLLRPYAKRIWVIDDLANREHNCDILLDQNYYDNMAARYQTLVPEACKMLIGPEFLLLRKEFIEARRKMPIRNGEINNILVFFGGSDHTNQTKKTLLALDAIDNSNIKIHVVIGGSNPHKDEIFKMCCKRPNIQYHYQIDYIAQLITQCDLAVGAGGSVTWERCYLGLPAITICIAENQVELLRGIAKKGAVINLGWYSDVKEEDIARAVNELINDRSKVHRMGMAALSVVEKNSPQIFAALFATGEKYECNS